MKIKACIFDLDGVIVDTALYHYQSWKKIADGLGIPFSEKDNEQLKGVSRTRSLEIILKLGNLEIDKTTREELAREKNSGYLDYIRSMSPDEVLPGVKRFLQELKQKGVRIALGSSSKNARMILEKSRLLEFFDEVVDGTDVSATKPDPEIFRTASQRLGILPGDTVVFEDAQAGVQAALGGGFRCVGIGSPETLKGADLVLPSLEGLELEKLETRLDRTL